MTENQNRESYPDENPLDDMRVNEHGRRLSDQEYNDQLDDPSYQKAAARGVGGLTKLIRDRKHKKNK